MGLNDILEEPIEIQTAMLSELELLNMVRPLPQGSNGNSNETSGYIPKPKNAGTRRAEAFKPDHR